MRFVKPGAGSSRALPATVVSLSRVSRKADESDASAWRCHRISAFARADSSRERRSHYDLRNCNCSQEAKRLFDCLRILGDDRKQNPCRAFGLPMALFPVLNRIQRETKPCSELRLA